MSQLLCIRRATARTKSEKKKCNLETLTSLEKLCEALIKVALYNFSPLSISKCYYCWLPCSEDIWIFHIFVLRVANNDPSGQNTSLFNHFVYNRDRWPVSLPFPG